jgi:hypothetical protein
MIADVLGAAAPLVAGRVVVMGCVVVTGGCVVVTGGCVVVVTGGCVVVVVVGGCVVVVVVVVGAAVVVVVVVVAESEVVALLLGAGPGAVDDGAGVYTVGMPSVPWTVTVSVSGAPGVAGLVTAGAVFGPLLLPLLLVSVHTSPVVAAITAISAAANNNCGRLYQGSRPSATGGSSGGRKSICGRAPVALASYA